MLNGASESPANASPGTGTATVAFDPIAHSLTIDLTFGGLLAPTTAAHIHCCTAAANTGTAGAVVTVPSLVGFPLGVTSGAYSAQFDTLAAGTYGAAFVTNNGGTLATAEQALYTGLLTGRAYLNLHTSQFPGGEIRGFLALPNGVPEPSLMALAGLGLAVSLRRRRPR